VRFALVFVVALTGVAFAGPKPVVPSLTAQELRDIADGTQIAEDLTYQIPTQDKLRAILQLIRKGASCKRTDNGCSELGQYEAPGPKDTQRSPCFRRWYLWALVTTLDPDQELHLDESELRAVTKLDVELIELIGGRLDAEQQVELAHHLSSQKRDVPFILDLDFPLAKKALQKYHLDEAVDSIAADVAPDLLFGVVLDPRYKIATRIETLQRLSTESDVDPARLAQIVRPLLADPSLEVAAAVADQIGASLVRPPTNDRSLFLRVLAIFAKSDAIESEVALSYAPRGLDIISPMGERSEHIGPDPQHPDNDSWFAEELASAIRARLRFQPPLFGTDAYGHVILTGFVDVPEPPVAPNVCDNDDYEIDGL
jgi:hypothetical protein